MNKIALALDLEIDQEQIIEIGITSIDLREHKILTTYDMLILPEYRISDEVYNLTGLTYGKLKKAGISLEEAFRRITEKYGGMNRLWVVDSNDEVDTLNEAVFENWIKSKRYLSYRDLPRINQINISTLFALKTGNFTGQSLESMLTYHKLEFEGCPHRVNWDSHNIARLFLELIK